MFHHNEKNRIPWQFRLINEVVAKEISNGKQLSDICSEYLFETKKKNSPQILYKFYSPSIENISDVQNRLLWLASSSMFNDPYDCKLYAPYEDFRQYYTIRSFTKSSMFSSEEKNIIYRTLNPCSHAFIDSFQYQFNRIVEQNGGQEYKDFASDLWRKTFLVKKYIDSKMQDKYRIACFSAYKWDSKNYEQLMWAHYAQSHKGFCVKFDISPLFDETLNDETVLPLYSVDNILNGYLVPSKQRQMIINGLFPIKYTSERIKLSKTLCYAIAENTINTKQQCEIENKIFRALIAKMLPWQYEQEWRLIIDSNVSEKVRHKIPFPFAKEIITGINASDELKKILTETAKVLDIKIRTESIV